MSCRFSQLPNNGWNLTNELGYILQDAAFSAVQVRELRQCSDCFCPSKQVTCLRVPCDLVGDACLNTTLPLFDAATRAPFRIKAGTLLNDLIIIKNRNACIDDCTCFILGTICGDECCDPCSPQRWVSESCPITGAQLNCCCTIKVDVAKQTNQNCPLYLCRNGDPCNPCKEQYVPKGYDYSGPVKPQPGPHGDEYAKDASGNDCPQTYVDEHGCCKFAGPCPLIAGEFKDCSIGITLLSGCLRQNDILIAVESWERCCLDSCEDGPEDACAGIPRYVHRGYPNRG